MFGRGRRCARCKADLVDGVAPVLEGTDPDDGRTRVRLTGVPVQRCPQGHPEIREAKSQPLMLVLHQMVDDLEAAARCGCGEAVTTPIPHRWDWVVPTPDGPVEVELFAPGLRCDVCAVVVPDPEVHVVEQGVAEAMLVAAREGGVRP